MRETELWARMSQHLGSAYVQVWAQQTSLADLGGHTVAEALAAGLPCKRIWRAVWAALGLPDSER